MNDYKQTEDWIRRTRPESQTSDAMDQRILADAQGAMPVGQGGGEYSTISTRRIFMRSTMRLTAAAAVIVIGVTLFFLFGTTPNTIALAAVYAKVQQAQAFMYQMHMTVANNAEMTARENGQEPMQMEMVITMSSEYGMKMENQIAAPGPDGQPQRMTQLVYMRLDNNEMISIIPEQRVYQKVELTPGMAEKTRAQNNDPREMIKQMLDCEYVSLGPSEMNGVKVQGFETKDPAYGDGLCTTIKAKLWVDAETWLPYYMEIAMDMGGLIKIESTADNFQWDIPVAAEDFAVVIPEDYKELESLAVSQIDAENVEATKDKMKSMVNIKKLLLAGFKYGDKNGQWPATLEGFAGEVNPEVLVNPASPERGYVYIRPQGQYPNAESVVIYEHYEQWGEGINVGFGDGHVEFMKDEAEFLKRLGSSQ